MDATRDEAWFEAAYRVHEPAVRRYAVRRVGVRQADALVAAVFTGVWRHRDDAPEPLLPWLYGVAGNQPGAWDAPRLVTGDLPMPGVHQALAALPIAQAEVLRLAHWERLDKRGVGTALVVTPRAAAVRLRRAEAVVAEQVQPGIGAPSGRGGPSRTLAVELLRAADPAAGLPATPPELLADRVRAIIEAPEDAPAPSPPRRPRRWWPLVLLLVVALLATVAVSVREQIAFLTADRAAWADRVLVLAAEGAVDPERRGDQYWRIIERGVRKDLVDRRPASGYAVRIDQVRYKSVDGSGSVCFDARLGGEVVDTFGGPRYPVSPYRNGVTCYEGDNALFWRSDLPMDAGRLARFLERRVWGPGPAEEQAFAMTTALLGTGQLAAAQRAAIFSYLQDVPRVEVIHQAVPVDDRVGVAIGIADAEAPYPPFIIIDEQTGEFLGTGWRGEHAQYAVRITRDVVDELPADVVEQACLRASGRGPLVCPE